jgi:hypothetical protein
MKPQHMPAFPWWHFSACLDPERIQDGASIDESPFFIRVRVFVSARRRKHAFADTWHARSWQASCCTRKCSSSLVNWTLSGTTREAAKVVGVNLSTFSTSLDEYRAIDGRPADNTLMVKIPR